MSIIWLTFSLIAGCAAKPKPVLGHDFVLPSCEPTATELVFGLIGPECASGVGKRGSIRVKLHTPLPSDGLGRYELGEKGTADATWCSANEQSCATAISGFIQINGLDHGMAVSGDYSMIFSRRQSIEGVFGAEWCGISAPCEETR